MNKYEMMFIVNATLDENACKEVVSSLEEIVKAGKAENFETKDLGQKKLAYPIKKEITGHYYVFNFSLAENDKTTRDELDRKARINENVLRHLIIKLDEE